MTIKIIIWFIGESQLPKSTRKITTENKMFILSIRKICLKYTVQFKILVLQIKNCQEYQTKNTLWNEQAKNYVKNARFFSKTFLIIFERKDDIVLVIYG